MGFFYTESEERFMDGETTGFPLYRRILNQNWKEFIGVGFLTLLFFLPFAGGMVYAVLSSSALVALLSGLLGGLIAGPGLACLYDLILRRLRRDRGDWWACWKRALRRNWRASLLPGAVQCVVIGMLVYSFMLLLWSAAAPSLGSLVLLLLAALFSAMVMSVWWPQVALFEQSAALQLKNALFFLLFHFGRVFGAAVLQLLWWGVLALFLPWTAFLVPVLGLWYILFLTQFLLYPKLNEDFKIEEQIRAAFPGRLDE